MGIKTMKHVYDRCEEEGGCMLWTQNVNSKGYPLASINGKPQLVARWLLEQRLGRAIKPRHCAVSTCGNKLCMSCIAEKSRSDVLADSYKTRRVIGPADIERRRAVAVARWGSKLDMPRAREIRALKGAGESSESVGKRYGVSGRTVREIWLGRRWREQAAANSVFTWGHAA